MKKSGFLIIFTLITLVTFGQIKVATDKDIAAFKKSKTLLVLDENNPSDFNDVIETCMKSFWTITPYEVISINDFEKKRKDPKYSFIILSEASIKHLNDFYNFNILNFVLGCSTGTIDDMPDLGSVPLSYVEVDEESYLYKMGAFLMYMQLNITNPALNENIKVQNLKDVCSPDLKKKELWFVKEDLANDINTIEKIKKIYSYPVKIVTAEEIEKAINEKKPNVAFLHKVGPEDTDVNSGYCMNFIISASNGQLLYSNDHKIEADSPDAFLVKDFKKIGK
jgi:hypothetical protein